MALAARQAKTIAVAPKAGRLLENPHPGKILDEEFAEPLEMQPIDIGGLKGAVFLEETF
ncbi:MAG: hypothetical protein HYS17_06755 [Micavibrio aeruginosavorus]|uniref:Uncharacterized protein n=1 Tax=Micavibrio aeruginosavorus TaxID=349221 RepID=A0A7T5R0G8_9BACT|nr:MAG: hypothetical protein HYS17_06755 [Micavibrio aeruginosavorus]